MKVLGPNMCSIGPIQHFTNVMEVLLISTEWLANGGLPQCSKLNLSYEFHFEGLSNFSCLVEGLIQIQNVNL
jgi:hypothetical protein